MRKVIYLDSLVLLNTVATFLILLSVRVFASVNTNKLRIITAAFFGGFSSMIMLLPGLPIVSTLFIRLSLGAAICFTAFFVGDSKKFFRCLGLFYLFTFACGGLMFVLSQVFHAFVTYQNGYAYVGLGFRSIVASITAAYLVLLVLRRKFGKGKEQFYYDIELTYGGVTVKGKAMLDSGHFVKDCYTGKPVVIACESFLRQLLSEQEIAELKAFGGLSKQVSAKKLRARCIPVTTVSGRRLLPVFTCSKVTVHNEDVFCSVNGVSLALADEFPDITSCDALINTELFQKR